MGVHLNKSNEVDIAGFVGLLAYFGVLILRARSSEDKTEERAARSDAATVLTESAAWQYTVGAGSFPKAMNDALARANYVQKIQNIEAGLNGTGVPFAEQLSPLMMEVRAKSLDDRKRIYAAARLGSVHERNAANETSARQSVRRWGTLILLVELLGTIGAVLKTTKTTNLDILGVSGTVASSLALWTEARNYREQGFQSAAHTRTAALANQLLPLITDERGWTEFVGRVEGQLTITAEAMLASDSASTSGDLQKELTTTRTMSPDRFFTAIRDLENLIYGGLEGSPKFEPDIIIAVNPGGAIVGGVLYFQRRATSFFPLSLRAGVETSQLAAIADYLPITGKRSDYLAVLLVDASTKTGQSLVEARDIVQGAFRRKGLTALPRAADGGEGDDKTSGAENHSDPPAPATPRHYVIKTAVLAARPSDPTNVRLTPDYCVDTSTDSFPYGTV